MKNTLCCFLPIALFAGACMDTDVPEPAADDTTEAVQAVTTTAFTATYRGQGSGSSVCGATFNISGREPDSGAGFPVFVYMVGTTESFTNASASAAVADMASRGFVAATVAYNSGSFSGCSTISGKARCIFNPSSSTSAISTLCARAKADCSKGVVVAGFSQGAVMGTLARNFDARVQAAWGIGDGVQYSFFNLRSCMANGNRTLPSNRLRAVIGERDQFIGPTAADVRDQMLSLTGLSCGSTGFNCLQANGSGWYIVRDAEVGDGSADHCHMRATGNCSGSQNVLDAGWRGGTEPWQLAAGLDFLDSFIQQ